MPLSFASCIAHALTRSLAHARPCLPPSSPFRTQEAAEIEDATQTNLVNLRRTIYLTIMSSLDFEEVRCKGYWLCYTLYRLCYTLYRLCYTLYRLCYTEEVGCKGYRLQGVLAARGVGYRLQGISEAARGIGGCKGYRRLQGVSEAARGIGCAIYAQALHLHMEGSAFFGHEMGRGCLDAFIWDVSDPGRFPGLEVCWADASGKMAAFRPAWNACGPAWEACWADARGTTAALRPCMGRGDRSLQAFVSQAVNLRVSGGGPS